uniref:Secreted protein n=1 Tax=Steinernema glaseri TaxID=37863 RepID=A0A1I7ZXY0_9BILA
MEHPAAPYPDMNMIFKGIPKMMQVADDMHRMTDYIQDLRNMTLALGVMSFIGILLFLLVKFKSGRRTRRRRREDTYRPIPFTPEPWDRSNGSAHKIDMEKLRLSSPSHQDFNNAVTPTDHAQSNGGPMHKKHEPVKLMVESLPYADSS